MMGKMNSDFVQPTQHIKHAMVTSWKNNIRELLLHHTCRLHRHPTDYIEIILTMFSYNFLRSSPQIGGLCSVFASSCRFRSTHFAPNTLFASVNSESLMMSKPQVACKWRFNPNLRISFAVHLFFFFFVLQNLVKNFQF